jgi:hypothetical protein
MESVSALVLDGKTVCGPEERRWLGERGRVDSQ